MVTKLTKLQTLILNALHKARYGETQLLEIMDETVDTLSDDFILMEVEE